MQLSDTIFQKAYQNVIIRENFLYYVCILHGIVMFKKLGCIRSKYLQLDYITGIFLNTS